MAITTLAQLEAARSHLIPLPVRTSNLNQGETNPHWKAFWWGTQNGAASPTSGLNGETVSSSHASAIPLPAAGDQMYLAEAAFDVQSTSSTLAIQDTSNVPLFVGLADRLWLNQVSDVTTTTEQAITSPTWPARDHDASTNGRGVMLALEVYTIATNGSTISTTTVKYTNSAGTANRTATLAHPVPNTAQAGVMTPFALQAGDVGVRSVQGVTLGSSYTSGALSVVAYRPIVTFSVAQTLRAPARGPLLTCMQKIWDDSALYAFQAGGLNGGTFAHGSIRIAQG